MDKLSFELLTNRHQYRKYLDKIDPKKFEETTALRENVLKYRSRIMAAIKDYLYDTTEGFNVEIDEILPTLIRQFIRYFESQDMEEKMKNKEKKKGVEWNMDGPDEEDANDSLEENEEEGDEEDTHDDEGSKEESQEEPDILNALSNKAFIKSYWGKSYIRKTDI